MTASQLSTLDNLPEKACQFHKKLVDKIVTMTLKRYNLPLFQDSPTNKTPRLGPISTYRYHE